MKKTYFKIYLLMLIIAIIGVVAYKFNQSNNDETKSKASLQSQEFTATDQLVEKLEKQHKDKPKDVSIMIELASAYIQKSRETGDTDYYDKIDGLMDNAQALDSNNADIYFVRGNIALSRHNFKGAVELGKKSIELNPNKTSFYGVLVDANTELGNYDQAIQDLQTMVDMRPDYNSYSRISYARELRGDIAGARQAIQTAVDAGASFPENVAWGYVEIGKLDFREDLQEAERQFNLALQVVPNYAPAFEQLGKVAFAKGDNQKAIEWFNKAFERLPLAQYAIGLAEIYSKSGDETKAKQYYSLAQSAFAKSANSGVNTDLEYSLFLSEHNLDPQKSLELSIRSFEIRQSVHGADGLAWAYYVNGNYEQAQAYIEKALALGENDPLIVYHAGRIEEKLGNSEKAKQYFNKAYDLSKNFSIIYNDELKSKIN